jgi:hypothetical protein
LAPSQDRARSAAPEAHSPAATATTEAARATAATVTCPHQRACHRQGLCVLWVEPVKNPGLCVAPSDHVGSSKVIVDTDAPWSPVPVRQAREFLRANPDARIEIIFPTVYEEDRSK